MANDISATVKVIGVQPGDHVNKFEAVDPNGVKKEFTMSLKGDGITPEIGETVTVEYGISTKEYKGKPETTFWVNGWRPGQPFDNDESAARTGYAYQDQASHAELQASDMSDLAHQTEEPKKAVNSYDEADIRKEKSFERQRSLETAKEILIARAPEKLTAQDVAKFANDICADVFGHRIGVDPVEISDETLDQATRTHPLVEQARQAGDPIPEYRE